jgi:TolA-binding protein
MPKPRISGLIAASLAALVFTAAATAQVPKGMGPLSSDTQSMAANGDTSSRRLEGAASALQSKNFTVAEGLLEDILRTNPTNPDANFYMGVAKMGLEKWDDAKKYLEVAVKKNPKEPDPKSRLAVTLIKLGDVDGAKAQREALVKLSDKCKGKCRNAEWITNGIAMVDTALAAGS